ncbi:hypothetical protein FACS1894181_00700 [Bacteroidia bacterium]|nr:hypothetical protein FACS1894181_00700 [Bacteroidia bacterium]
MSSKLKFTGGTYNSAIANEYIHLIKKLAAEGVIKPVIDRQYCFDEIPLAHEYVDKGHKKGNVVVTITDES